MIPPSAIGPVALSVADVAAAASGRVVSGSPQQAVDRVSIDSRTLRPGDLFFAIRGERFDGHRFASDALDAGACGVVVSDLSALRALPAGQPAIVQVADPTGALQALARHVRRASGSRVVAITGSAGKTTTKEIAAELLGLRFRVFRNQGNFNNHIGLPLSLIELRHAPEIAVVELGMSHAGEISLLTSLAEPDVRVWTLVAEVHSAFFNSIEGIADAKAELLEGASSQHLVVANAGDPRIMARVGRCPARLVTFGVEVPADVAALSVEDRGLDGTAADVMTPAGRTRFQIPLLGRGHLANTLAATAVALEFGIPLDAIAERVSTLSPAPRRGEVIRLPSGVTLIDDSYNSNPRALDRMLEVLAKSPAGRRRVAILGEMLELGEATLPLHEACGRAAADAGLARLITVGGQAALAMATAAVGRGLPADAATHVETSDEAARLLYGWLRPGDVVLVKGSRGVGTDVVVEALRAVGA
jgi:UDP-N-acetylmuramoyl-tripeptide--D-alanyl-D-alanine ligase